MAEKVRNIKKSGYNSETIKQNVLFNSLCERYFDYAEINFEKNHILNQCSCKKVQNGRKRQKIIRKVVITQE